MEADKSQDLKSASLAAVQVRRAGNQERWCCSSVLYVGGHETQEELMFLFKSKGRKQEKTKQHLTSIGQEQFVLPAGRGSPSVPAFDWSDRARPHRAELSDLLSPLIQMLTSSKHTLTNTPRLMSDQVSGHPWLSQVTRKINHRSQAMETVL